MLREFICECLSSPGYEVTAASSGEEALKLAEEATQPFGMVITDVVMTGIGGEEVVDRLRSTQPKIKVIFMSGYTGGRISPPSVPTSGLAFLEKPFTPADLARQVRASLGARPRPSARKPGRRSRKAKPR